MGTTAAVSDAEARFDAIRRKVGLLLAPVSFAVIVVLPFPSLSTEAHALAAVAAMTVVLWVTEAIPLAAAAFLGPALAVMLGVADAKTALAPFADPLIFLFLGGFMLAGALSRQGFDRRAALWLISRPVVGGRPARAMVAIAIVAFAFSMWISNTATTAMLIPVALGLHATIRDVAGSDEDKRRALARYGGGMCLALAYAASLGGASTPIGTGPNVIAMGMLEDQVGIRLDFGQWMSFALPPMMLLTAVMLWFMVRRFPSPVERLEGLTAEVDRQLDALGPISPGEIRAVAVFGLAVLGWLTPSLLALGLGKDHPWTTWSHESLEEGVVAIVCATLLFFIPAGRRAGQDPREENAGRVLEWEDAQNLDWGTLFLLGGGLALGKLTFLTGLAEAIGRGVLDFAGPIAAHPLGLTAAATLLVIYLTEVTSNTATTSMMLPVLIGIAQAGEIDARFTAIAVTLAASCAFMLPVSTPPNAMAYGTRMIRIDAMIRTGAWLDILGYAILMATVVLLLPVLL